MRSDWHLVVLHFLSAFLRWRLALMTSLLIQGTLGRHRTSLDMIGAWRSKRRRSVLYRSTSFSGLASLNKSIRAISSLNEVRSKDFCFRKLICFTVGDGLGTERLHNTEQWSEIYLSEIGLPLIILSELRVITKSKICPWICVGDLTCRVRHIDSNKSANLAASTSPLTSRWKLKSPDMQSGTLDSNNESR